MKNGAKSHTLICVLFETGKFFLFLNIRTVQTQKMEKTHGIKL